MKTTSLVLVLLSIVSICQCVDFLGTDTAHLGICYNSTEFTDQLTYPAQSLDNLLAIIEKIEKQFAFASKSPDAVASFILKRFRVDGIRSSIISGDPEPHYDIDTNEGKRGQLILKVVRSLHFSTVLDNIDFLTDQEICALHWMVSHTVNNTVLREEDGNEYWRPTPNPIYSRRKRQIPNTQKRHLSHYPREGGIIYTGSNDAVAAGSVLAGIAVMSDVFSNILLRDFVSGLDESSKDLTINRFHAASYAINLALPVVLMSSTPILGPKGFWNGTICPSEYILEKEFLLDKEHLFATNAIIFGSFDGYLIGTAWESSQHKSNFKLSQILRMYYGKGFPQNREIRSCNRIRNILGLLRADAIMRQQLEYAIILLMVDFGKGPGKITSGVDAATKLLTGLKTNYTETKYPSSCPLYDENSIPDVQPTVDLYVVLDKDYLRGSFQYYDIASLVAKVADLLDVSNNASHIGIYVDDKKLFSSFFPLNDTVNEAEWKCNVINYDTTKYYPQSQENPIETIRSLKAMFLELKTAERNRKVKVTPTRVVLFARSSAISRHDEVVWEMELFRKDHPEIKILGVANGHDKVRSIVPDKNDFISIMTAVNQEPTAKKIYNEHLQKFGLTLYIPNCDSNDGISSDVQNLVLAPFTRQYLEIPSQMFNLSTDFKVEVQYQGMPVKVCWSRTKNIFKYPPTDTKCEVASGNTVVAYFGDPCSSYSAGACPSIFFQVTRSDFKEKDYMPCDQTQNKLCRTHEDIQYSLKLHNGRCSGCSIKVAINLFAACLIASLIGKLF